MGGWLGWGGVVGEVRDKAISTQVVVEVEVGVEHGNFIFNLRLDQPATKMNINTTF